MQRIKPDTPVKKALYVSFIAGILGFAAYTIIKNRK